MRAIQEFMALVAGAVGVWQESVELGLLAIAIAVMSREITVVIDWPDGE